MARAPAVAAIVILALAGAGLGTWYALGRTRRAAVHPAEGEAPLAVAGQRSGEVAIPPGVSIDFQEVAEQAGIRFRHFDGRGPMEYIMDTTAPGLAWLDYDGDGLMDLFLVQGGNSVGPQPSPAPTCRLYHNEGDGRFRDVTEALGVAHVGCGQGAGVGDVDNDGDPDLFVTCFGKPNALYRNEGGERFVEVAAEAGLAAPTAGRDGPNWGTSVAFLDFDGDGFLDLFVGNYVEVDPDRYPVCMNSAKTQRLLCPPEQFPPSRCALYRNRGDGTFEDVSARAGIDLPESKALGVVTLDFDDDGRTDIFVANDGVPNFLFRNLGGGKFESVGLSSGCAVNSASHTQAYMGVDAEDLDGDGRPDIYATAFAKQTDTLFRNEGGGLFVDVTPTSGLGPPSWYPLAFGVSFLDVDLDGAPDIFVANGHVNHFIDEDGDPLETFKQRAQLYRNLGKGEFADISDRAGPYFQQGHVGRGVGPCDYDNDGRMDLAIANSGEATALLHNLSKSAHHWIRLELRGTMSNRDAVGAKVTLKLSGGRELVRHRKGGGAYLSAGDPRLLVGLGRATRVEAVEVRWPSGLVQRTGLSGRRRVGLRGGEALAPLAVDTRGTWLDATATASAMACRRDPPPRRRLGGVVAVAPQFPRLLPAAGCREGPG